MNTVTAVIGLGYVGLPLVVEFGKHSRTIGFDINEGKVAACQAGIDPSRELSDAQMAEAVHAENAALAEDDLRRLLAPDGACIDGTAAFDVTSLRARGLLRVAPLTRDRKQPKPPKR